MLRFPIDFNLPPRCSFGPLVLICPLLATEGSASSSHRRAGRRTHRAGARGAATLPRAVPRNFPRPATPWSSAAERPRRSFGESPASRTEEQRGEFSAPKAFVLHAASSRRAATRARSTNFAKASRPRKNLPSLSHNHFGERRGAGSESFGTDTCGTDASGAVALFSAAP